MSAGTAHGDDQHRLPLRRIQRQREGEQVLQLGQEIPGLLEAEYVVGDGAVQPRQIAQLFAVTLEAVIKFTIAGKNYTRRRTRRRCTEIRGKVGNGKTLSRKKYNKNFLLQNGCG